MEKFLFSSVPVWLVFLLAVIGITGTVFFGTIVVDEAEGRLESDRQESYNWVGDLAYEIARTPKTAIQLLTEGNPRRARRMARLGKKEPGWTILSDAARIDGYLLLSRTDGEADLPVVELVDLQTFEVKHAWRVSGEELMADASRASKIADFTHWYDNRFRAAHPFVFPNGDLLVRNHDSPLVRVDHCVRPIWMQDSLMFHHSTNIDANGNFWVGSRVEPSEAGWVPKFDDNSIALISPDGDILFHKSIAEIFEDNDLTALVFGAGTYSNDPLHLNDIQPALSDGPYWKRDDVFLSLRHRSMILQYRPSTNEIIWMKQGPWMAQHDVDIIDDHTIAVFNNNVFDRGKGWYVDGTSNILFYDFETNEVTNRYAEAMEENKVLTVTEGLFEMTESGHMIVEEENSARILIFAPDKTLAAEYMNGAADGEFYRLGWSRYISRDHGDQVIAAIDAAPPCEG